MIKTITREEFIQLKDSESNKTQVVDVLGADHFEKEHVKDAVSIPVDRITEQAENRLKKEDNVVVYCANTECNASLRAAEQLESLGFKHIYDYQGGIEDYKKAGLPLEGTEVEQRT